MSSVVPIALFALAGVLVGGIYSMHKQGASRAAIGVLAILAVVALGAGVLWLFPDK
jgi:hypothetical protein